MAVPSNAQSEKKTVREPPPSMCRTVYMAWLALAPPRLGFLCFLRSDFTGFAAPCCCFSSSKKNARRQARVFARRLHVLLCVHVRLVKFIHLLAYGLVHFGEMYQQPLFFRPRTFQLLVLQLDFDRHCTAAICVFPRSHTPRVGKTPASGCGFRTPCRESPRHPIGR